jgi:xanthine dehydrogenase YagS FAD-binding subunit
LRPFQHVAVDSAQAAVQVAQAAITTRGASPLQSPAQLLAGGTTLIDLMKLDVMQPEMLVDINALERGPLGRIEAENGMLRLGALVRMADAAEHPDIKRNYPMIAQSLKFAASQQLRNMASLGGNVLQRTRCTYFRDVTYEACNKRNPGSGCAAIDGFNRAHAVLGTSDSCIATYPGDFAQALIALDASVELNGASGRRSIPFATLHRKPGDSPHIETSLGAGDMITAFVIPSQSWMRRSLYLKIRDRSSYEFALASAAVALDLEQGRARDVRIALGGVATVPWRAKEAEAVLRGKELSDESLRAAADAAFVDARPQGHSAFKVTLGKRTLIRALNEAAAMEI